VILAATASNPTPFWYATRGSGYAALVLLSAVVVLGLLTSVRWQSPRWPRFLSQSLHRNLSLMVVVFVVIHIATSIIDPFAGLSVRDAVVPFGASYRPLWLGLGVVSFELLLAIIVTSLLRGFLGWRAWQIVHLLAYVSWPVAVLHGVGTGTDTKALWALFLVIVCVGAVALTLVWRLSVGWPRWAPARAVGIVASLASVIALTAWTASGPLQAGWAKAAGTPPNLLASGASGGAGPSASPSPPAGVSAIPVGLNDSLTGTLQQSGTAVTAVLTDQRDPTLQVTIQANPDGSGRLNVTVSGTTVCAAPASIRDTVTARCGSVLVGVQLFQETSGSLSGSLVTQAAGQ
jgi:methionine sulfoxide reductase heme-binding subunit